MGNLNPNKRLHSAEKDLNKLNCSYLNSSRLIVFLELKSTFETQKQEDGKRKCQVNDCYNFTAINDTHPGQSIQEGQNVEGKPANDERQHNSSCHLQDLVTGFLNITASSFVFLSVFFNYVSIHKAGIDFPPHFCSPSFPDTQKVGIALPERPQSLPETRNQLSSDQEVSDSSQPRESCL
ncbi:hypothetical protein A6R68_11084 [Neotoma lepida]|uniref:Uncharacterized protein n=1 Tax=Neotoma lepida TaxID=56216 RepID=A0A1A6FW58_NEOLE|nr:hypothetical protein A6R68_11084 [Neotoma lepida]